MQYRRYTQQLFSQWPFNYFPLGSGVLASCNLWKLGLRPIDRNDKCARLGNATTVFVPVHRYTCISTPLTSLSQQYSLAREEAGIMTATPDQGVTAWTILYPCTTLRWAGTDVTADEVDSYHGYCALTRTVASGRSVARINSLLSSVPASLFDPWTIWSLQHESTGWWKTSEVPVVITTGNVPDKLSCLSQTLPTMETILTELRLYVCWGLTCAPPSSALAEIC